MSLSLSLPLFIHSTLEQMDDPSPTITLQQLLHLISHRGRYACSPWRTSTSRSQDKPTSLPRLLRQIIPFIQTQEKQNLWESVYQLISNLKIVESHASILGGVRLFLEKKRSFLPDPADCYANLLSTEVCSNNCYLGEVEAVWVLPFLQDLQEVFEVPKLNHPRNVLVANFISFLLQLLIGNPYLFASGANLVINELRSFIIIFLDTPFQTTENDGQVHTLLSQFETLANEAARLVHSFLFSPDPPPRFKKIDELLLEPITLLKVNVILFFNSPSCNNTATNTLHFGMSSAFIVDSLLYDLENLMNREDDSILEIKGDVEKLHQSLKHSWLLLEMHSDKIDEVKEIVVLAFAAEWLINYFLCGDAPAWYLAIRLPGIIHNVEIVGTRLEGLVLRESNNIDGELKARDDFGARQFQTEIKSSVKDTVVGFEDEELKILGELVGTEKGLQIISIIGMPGIGKTTLAKKMYNHPIVRYKFDRISWCIVSQEYKVKNILVDILKGLDPFVKNATVEKESEDKVGEGIYKTLKGQRYFIVVDDIWESRAWESVKRYLPDDRNYSRILFTSRNKQVADQCNSTIHALPLLSHEQCWEILKKKVFNTESCPPNLQHIGETIASKCSGLPLVVVVVSGILSTMKKDLSVWKNVSQTLDSYILSYQGRAVGKSLELSYMCLPYHLKPCFLYLGRFKEDEEISVKSVIQYWIAEGFVRTDKTKGAEDIAKEYLNELVDKNLIIVGERNYDGQAKVCRMHDLLRDLCLKIAEDDYFMKVVDGEMFFCDQKVHRMNCLHLYSAHSLPYLYIRSLACFGSLGSSLNVGHMKPLRVLEFRDMSELDGIQNLIHLRYLRVSDMKVPIKGKFSSLEFLIVDVSVRLTSSLLDGMPKLRYLSAFFQSIYMEFDCNTSRTYNLEYISRVFIKGEGDVQRLKVFPRIRTLKC